MSTPSADDPSASATDNKRLLVVSNRLPVALTRQGEGWQLKPGSGGLVSAMAPVLKERGGTWIGWAGVAGTKGVREALDEFSAEAGYSLRPTFLTEDEVNDFYFGFSNEIIWPLFHDFPSRCRFEPRYWRAYLDVNFKFAEEIAAAAEPDDFIWVHDYHLMHVAWLLRNMGARRKLGFFLHIPFPPVDIFLKLPWRDRIIQALMEFDLIGFQTYRDRRNFIQCVNLFYGEAKSVGRGPVVTLKTDGREVRVGSFPIGIDYKTFAGDVRKPAVRDKAADFRSALRDRSIILGVDRLDYSKGIPERFEALRTALIKYPDLMGNVSLVQILVPSRETVPEYNKLKNRIEQMVGEINGQFTRPGYIPIHYQYRSLDWEELLAYYRAASMALVTPLRDGMNLVAKEFCACNVDRQGVLFLSEFAGAAAQLGRSALLVNPHDVEGVARAIWRAWRMDPAEKRSRMTRLQTTVRRSDIFWWVEAFLNEAMSEDASDT